MRENDGSCVMIARVGRARATIPRLCQRAAPAR